MFTTISTYYTFPKTIEQGLNSSEVGTKIENLGVSPPPRQENLTNFIM